MDVVFNYVNDFISWTNMDEIVYFHMRDFSATCYIYDCVPLNPKKYSREILPYNTKQNSLFK